MFDTTNHLPDCLSTHTEHIAGYELRAVWQSDNTWQSCLLAPDGWLMIHPGFRTAEGALIWAEKQLQERQAR